MGVRQGDPFSPILFGIAEDVLSHLFLNCVASKHLVSMNYSRSRDFPTHLLYADDILIFCKASVRNATAIKRILDYYGSISGQICSQDKSHIYFSDRVPLGMRRRIDRVLGFANGSLPVTYLGVPLFVGRPRASHFQSIKDRIVQKFSKWKGKQLSMAGRICLVKSVIQSSITHSMMVFRWPQSLLNDLDKCCRNFIWSGQIDKKSSCAVKWGRCIATREEGGLGIRSFTVMNKSYLMKMAWRLVKGADMASDLLRSRYLTVFGCAKENVANTSVWIGLKQEVNELVNESYSLVGNGCHTRFWTDDWLGYKLCDKLSVPVFMHDFLHYSVADYFYDGHWHFSADFVSTFPDLVCDILIFPIGTDADSRFWKPSSKGEVTASLAFVRHCHRYPEVIWGSWIWEKFIPTRRSLLCWRILHGRLPTLDCLARQGFIGPSFCSLCMDAAESQNHIFWLCCCVHPIWRDFLEWFGQAHLMDSPDILSFLVKAWNVSFSSLIQSYWKLGIITLLWQIWTVRNRIVFENGRFDARVITKFLRAAFIEVDGSFDKLGHSSNDWNEYLVLRSLGVGCRPRPPHNFINVHWWPPATDWIKVNTDGSASGAPGSIAAGAVFRNCLGEVRGCFHIKGGVGHAFEAELLAVITAIAIAHSRGWHNLWVEADSTYVVRLLETRSLNVPWRFLAYWKDTIARLHDFRLQVSHIYREGNAAADIMANPNRQEGWWPHVIEEIQHAVIADLATHSFLRVS